MKIEPSGVVVLGVCEIQSVKCTAKVAAPITAVWELPGRRQINVCSSCLDEMIRAGNWQIEGARLKRRADVAVFDKSGSLQLVVEAKCINPDEDTLNRAVQIRRNLLAHSGIPNAPFFLIVFPGHLYLWKKRGTDTYERQADYSVEITFKSYAERFKKSFDCTASAEFERFVSEWIKDLTKANDESKIPDWANESGLYQAVKNGSVVREATV